MKLKFKNALYFVICISVFSKESQKFDEITSLYKEGLYIDVINKSEDFIKENPNSNDLNTIKLYLGEAQRSNGNLEKALSICTLQEINFIFYLLKILQ